MFWKSIFDSDLSKIGFSSKLIVSQSAVFVDNIRNFLKLGWIMEGIKFIQGRSGWQKETNKIWKKYKIPKLYHIISSPKILVSWNYAKLKK